MGAIKWGTGAVYRGELSHFDRDNEAIDGEEWAGGSSHRLTDSGDPEGPIVCHGSGHVIWKDGTEFEG